MKKVIKVLSLVIISIIGILLFQDDVYAATYSCSNISSDTCEKKEYKYAKDGSVKDFSITLGVFHFKNSNSASSNEEYVKSFDGCDYIQNTNYCSTNKYRFDADDVVISVDTNTNLFPAAICVIPYANSKPLNQPLTDNNARNYIYFSENEINKAISNGYCTEENVFYTELNNLTSNNVAKICVNKTSIYEFESATDLTNATLQTNLSKAGQNNICNIKIKSNKTFNYNHTNSDVLCTASSYQISCTGSGTYKCNLNLCGNAESDNKDNMVGNKCILVNETNSNDKIEYSYAFNKVDNLTHSNVLKQNNTIITLPIVTGNESFAATSSCPDYIYYDKTENKYYILDNTEKAVFDKEKSTHTVVSYRFTNSGNMDILEEDEIVETENSVPNSQLLYKCIYRGQINNSTLKIEKYENIWALTYPNGDTKLLPASNVGLGNMLPSSECEDVFYEINSKDIKAVEAGTIYTENTISGYCRSYTEEYEQYCAGKCKIENPPCGNYDPDDNGNDPNGCPTELRPVISFLKRVVINLVQIAVPIILIVMGSIDFTKAVIASDDKSNKDAISKFIKRILAAVLVFFVTTIVSIVIGMFAKTDLGAQDDWRACWNNID